MRILSYNILDGGQDRIEQIIEVIESQRPDIVGLVEADDAERVATIAKRLKMDFIHAAGNSHASALLTRWMIRDSITHAVLHPELSKSLLECTVEDRNGMTFTFGVLHLHAHGTEADEDIRMKELKTVLNLFEPHRRENRPHILCGDFNANSPVQIIDPARCKARTRREWEANGGELPRRAIQMVLDSGYCDSLHASDPRNATTVGSFNTEWPGQRVDYIFTHGIPIGRLRSAAVIQREPAPKASDHFPVFAEFTE